MNSLQTSRQGCVLLLCDCSQLSMQHSTYSHLKNKVISSNPDQVGEQSRLKLDRN